MLPKNSFHSMKFLTVVSAIFLVVGVATSWFDIIAIIGLALSAPALIGYFRIVHFAYGATAE